MKHSASTGALMAVVLHAAIASASPGLPDCPEATPIELAVVPYARDSASCLTIVGCMNLDAKVQGFSIQFFSQFASDGQVGSTTGVLFANPGDSRQCGTRLPDPAGIRGIDCQAGALNFEGTARICTATRKFACHAVLSCSIAGAPLVQKLDVIVKKQKGD